MKKKIQIFLSWVLVLGLTVYSVPAILAATLEFNPASTTTDKGNSFEVEVVVDSGSDEISGTDAYVLYDSSLLELVSVEEGDHFPVFTYDTSTDKISMSGVVSDVTDSRSGRGVLGIITFRGNDAGTDELEIYCDLTKNDTSKIVATDVNATNLIECLSPSEGGTHPVTIQDNEPDPDPTNTPAPTSTPGPTPTALPQAGAFDNTVSYAVAGMALLMVGSVIRLAVLKK